MSLQQCPRFYASRKGGGGWVQPNGINSMAASGLSFIESPWSALGGPLISHLLCTNRLRKTIFWPCGASTLGNEALFSLWRGDHWPRAVTIESL